MSSRFSKQTLLIQYLAENFDKRLLYFTSVYLTSKKYIDFITLLPEPIVIKIISNIDPGIGLLRYTSGQYPANFQSISGFKSHSVWAPNKDTLEKIGKVSKTWKHYSLSNQVWKQNVEKADFPLVIYPGSHRAPSSGTLFLVLIGGHKWGFLIGPLKSVSSYWYGFGTKLDRNL